MVLMMSAMGNRIVRSPAQKDLILSFLLPSDFTAAGCGNTGHKMAGQ